MKINLKPVKEGDMVQLGKGSTFFRSIFSFLVLTKLVGLNPFASTVTTHDYAFRVLIITQGWFCSLSVFVVVCVNLYKQIVTLIFNVYYKGIFEQDTSLSVISMIISLQCIISLLHSFIRYRTINNMLKIVNENFFLFKQVKKATILFILFVVAWTACLSYATYTNILQLKSEIVSDNFIHIILLDVCTSITLFICFVMPMMHCLIMVALKEHFKHIVKRVKKQNSFEELLDLKKFYFLMADLTDVVDDAFSFPTFISVATIVIVNIFELFILMKTILHHDRDARETKQKDLLFSYSQTTTVTGLNLVILLIPAVALFEKVKQNISEVYCKFYKQLFIVVEGS